MSDPYESNPAEADFDALATVDATEAWILEVSADGHGYVPSRSRPFPTEEAANAALKLFKGGGVVSARVTAYRRAASEMDPITSAQIDRLRWLEKDRASICALLRARGFVMEDDDTCWRLVKQALGEAELAPKKEAPVPIFLTCPICGARHIDEGEFATKVHHTHSCQKCGLSWRPAVVPTIGVQFLPGFKNEPEVAQPAPVGSPTGIWKDGVWMGEGLLPGQEWCCTVCDFTLPQYVKGSTTWRRGVPGDAGHWYHLHADGWKIAEARPT